MRPEALSVWPSSLTLPLALPSSAKHTVSLPCRPSLPTGPSQSHTHTTHPVTWGGQHKTRACPTAQMWTESQSCQEDVFMAQGPEELLPGLFWAWADSSGWSVGVEAASGAVGIKLPFSLDLVTLLAFSKHSCLIQGLGLVVLNIECMKINPLEISVKGRFPRPHSRCSRSGDNVRDTVYLFTAMVRRHVCVFPKLVCWNLSFQRWCS